MKHLIHFLAISITIILSSCTSTTYDTDYDNLLLETLEERNYFKLNRLLENREYKIPENKVHYYKAFVYNAFGECHKSNEHIDLLLKNHNIIFEDSTIVKLLRLKATNHLNTYEYKLASELYGEIITEYTDVLDSLEILEYQNVKNLFGAFSNVKPQVMHLKNAVKIKSFRNKFNHLMVPVKTYGILEDFIFDTGANISTISEGQAKKMNLRIRDINVDVGSSTSASVQSKLAVADSLYLGGILFENVLFLVMPDEKLTFPEIDYQIHGIIGFPVIHQLGEVHLHKDGSITAPKIHQQRTQKNMFLEGLNPVVQLISDKDTLLFTFDTGAKQSELSFNYYKKHKSQIERDGKSEENIRGGAGGMYEVNEFILNNFPIKIGTKSTSLPSISVTLEEYAFNKHFDGNLGQDVFTQFNTLIINFKLMFVDFE